MSDRRCPNCGHIFDMNKTLRLPNGKVAMYGTCPDCLIDTEKLPGRSYREEYNLSPNEVVKTPITLLQQYDEFGEPLPMPEPMKEEEEASDVYERLMGDGLPTLRFPTVQEIEEVGDILNREFREQNLLPSLTTVMETVETLGEDDVIVGSFYTENNDHPSQGEQDVIQNDDTTSSITSLDDYI